MVITVSIKRKVAMVEVLAVIVIVYCQTPLIGKQYLINECIFTIGTLNHFLTSHTYHTLLMSSFNFYSFLLFASNSIFCYLSVYPHESVSIYLLSLFLIDKTLYFLLPILSGDFAPPTSDSTRSSTVCLNRHCKKHWKEKEKETTWEQERDRERMKGNQRNEANMKGGLVECRKIMIDMQKAHHK